ncbi:MAG: MerR family transcriptional regulator [Nocardioides sp.]|nr:MerR family transcriptional regulator [Nocardioides sp.]
MSDVDSGHAVYSISVASELSGVDPQMLRTYEQRGLVRPFRTGGGTRRYSRDDIDRIADITTLLSEGLNLAGIGHVLKLRDKTNVLATELSELQAASEPDRQELRRLRRENHDLKAELVRRGRPDTSPTQRGKPSASRSDDGSLEG